MTKRIGKVLTSQTSIIRLESARPRILDLCMAPGGLTATAAYILPGSLTDAVTLPPEVGGYEVMAQSACQNIIYGDITTYSKEMAYEGNISPQHPDREKFEICQPFLESLYDIVICGGAVVRDHSRECYRADCESRRLTVSELVFAMNRLRPDGPVVLLHRIESWDTVCILHAFNQFSDIQLYKDPKAHTFKSSFYLVAKNININHRAVRDSIAYWKALWKYPTFKEFGSIPLPHSGLYDSSDAFVRKLQDEFGAKFLRIARPIWEIQARALRNATFT